MSEEPFFGYETEQDRDAAVKKLETFLKEIELNEFEDNLEYINKLNFVTFNMKREILQEVDLRNLAICFKFSTTAFLKKFFDGLSSSLKQEILYGLQGKYTVGEVIKTLDDFVKYLKRKEADGSLILDEKSDKYV